MTANLERIKVPGFNPMDPHYVPDPDGVLFLVKDRSEAVPQDFSLLATTAEKKVILRVCGGCSEMGTDDKVDMFQIFGYGLNTFKGVISAGASRDTTADGALDPMITDIPGYIRALNPACVALGTVPRTDDLMKLVGHSQSRLTLGGGHDPNPCMSAILLVQNGVAGNLGWDGDLEDYFGMMEKLLSRAKFERAGIIAWNGGGVTFKEINESARRGWPTILVRGSGRRTDEYIKKFEAGDSELMQTLPENHCVTVVERSDPQTLRDALIHHGFIDPPVPNC